MRQAWQRWGTAAIAAAWCLAGSLAGGCFRGHVTTENTVEVKPIHITIDVNVHVQKDLDNFFGDIDKK